MSNISFSLSISHTPWVPERVASFERLKSQLGELPQLVQIMSLRAPNWLWSEKMWRTAANLTDDVNEPPSHHLFLQDDVEVHPDFWAILQAMVEAKPDVVIGLHTNHPMAQHLAMRGTRWITTSDGLVGVGYVFPHALLKDFLSWREGSLRAHAPEEINEDTLIGLWALDTGQRIHHPVPTIIDHQTELPSTYGNDHHQGRRSGVTWKMFKTTTPEQFKNVAFWQAPPRHVGCMYTTSPYVLQTILKEPDKGKLNAHRGDNAFREIIQLTYERRASGAPVPTRILLASPTRGGQSPNYSQSIWQLLRDESIEVISPFEVVDVQLWQEDLTRVRSRFVNYFLHETDATHLLFVDADIQFRPQVVKGMLAAMTPMKGERRHFIAAPYPKRDRIDFDRIRNAPAEVPAEAAAYRYSVRVAPQGFQVESNDCVEVAGIGLGCALLSRELLEGLESYFAEDPLDYEKMVKSFLRASYPEDAALTQSLLEPGMADFARYVARAARERMPLEFLDELPHNPSCRPPTTALFQLKFKDGGLLSEDYSFCERVREFGAKVWCYLGEGSPVNHCGEWVFEGKVEAFGLKRG